MKFWQVRNHQIAIHTYLLLKTCISVCAGGGHLSIAQEAAVKRPNGEAVLTCNATGISGSAVHTYRWIDHNSHTPIYVFPVRG